VIGDLSTYSLSQFLMFSPETYFRLYELYNADVWPAQIAAAMLALVLIGLTRRPGPWRGRAALLLLALSWAAIAWLFFYRHYATINLAAPWMGAGFALQALLLMAVAALGGLRFQWAGDAAGRLGLGLLLYAVALHPLLGPAVGRAWAGVEVFGLAPDPTALGTLGLALMAKGRRRWLLAAVPVLWCIASGLTCLAMDYRAGLVTPAVSLVALLAMAGQAMARGRTAAA
jgi:hypothetical protein